MVRATNGSLRALLLSTLATALGVGALESSSNDSQAFVELPVPIIEAAGEAVEEVLAPAETLF